MDLDQLVFSVANFRDVFVKQVNSFGNVFETFQVLINKLGKTEDTVAMAKAIYELKISCIKALQENIKVLKLELLNFNDSEMSSSLETLMQTLQIDIENTKAEIETLS